MFLTSLTLRCYELIGQIMAVVHVAKAMVKWAGTLGLMVPFD